MVQEILDEAVLAVWGARSLLALLVIAAVVAFVVERLLRRRIRRWPGRWVPMAAMGGVLAGGLWLGWQTAFICDDAFISFRYARNFAEGHGLVWNEGERVEGYTNFLWTAGLGVLGKLGANIPQAALFGCLVSFVIALVVTAATVRRLAPRTPALPFAAIALAGASAFHTFATSGLETMPAAALVVIGMYSSTLRRRGALLAGLSLTGATLMRPDHVLFYACFGLAIALEDLIHGDRTLLRRLDVWRYVAYLAPFVSIYVPYFLIRWQFYGDLYPNTYYAKSAARSYWVQGYAYAAHFVSTSGAWAWVWTAVIALLGRARTCGETRLRVFTLLVVPVFTTYIMKVGGDFMAHRFFVPLMPVLAVTTEVGLRWRIARPGKLWRGIAGTAAALGLGAALLPVQLIEGRAIRWNISNEPEFYRIVTVDPLVIGCGWQRLGEQLHGLLTSKGVRPPVAAAAIGMLGYHSRLPVVDAMGLTNRAIAHKRVKVRGRPGHEKLATIPVLIEQGAVLDVGFSGDPSFRRSAVVRFRGARLYFLRFDPQWAEAIGRLPGVRLPDPERDVEVLVLGAPRERVLAGKKFFRDFLAIHPRRDELLRRIDERLAAIADFEGELPEGVRREGNGLRIKHGAPPDGASGEGWLASLPDRQASGKVGRIEIPIGPIGAEELRFALGGTPSEQISVQLVVDGKTVRLARPSGAPGLSPVSWRVDDLRGRTGVLVIDDGDAGIGRGILVDAIHHAPVDGDLR